MVSDIANYHDILIYIYNYMIDDDPLISTTATSTGDTMVIDNPVYEPTMIILRQPSTTLLQDRVPHNLSEDHSYEEANTLNTEPTGAIIVNEVSSNTCIG